jgi:prepilin-type N-terminal cleavage/methylation domain-containing protein
MRRAVEITWLFAGRKFVYKEFCMKKGFTLIELLVVVLIIGVLSAIALPQYQKVVTKARVSEALQLGKALANAENMYYLESGTYTENLKDLAVEVKESKYFHFYFGCTNVGEAIQKSGAVLFRPKDLPLPSIDFHVKEGKIDYLYCSSGGKVGVCSSVLPCVTQNYGSTARCDFID